jgi:hypothetical protein
MDFVPEGRRESSQAQKYGVRQVDQIMQDPVIT